MNILILPGDGIGPEIVAVADAALQAVDRRFSLGLELDRQEAGLVALRAMGTTMPDDVAAKARAAHGVVVGPASTEDYPSAAEGGINISAWFRSQFDLSLIHI